MTNLTDLSHYPKTVLDRFQKFNAANPEVFQTFKAMAIRMKAMGKKKYSARTIMEVIRWDYDLKTRGEVFDLNNDFTPIYVRTLLITNPEFEGFFELRKVRSRGIGSMDQNSRELKATIHNAMKEKNNAV